MVIQLLQYHPKWATLLLFGTTATLWETCVQFGKFLLETYQKIAQFIFAYVTVVGKEVTIIFFYQKCLWRAQCQEVGSVVLKSS